MSKKHDPLKVTKREGFKRELARRLTTQLRRPIPRSEILDRREAAALAGYHPTSWTNDGAEKPNYYFVDKGRLGPNGLMLFLRSHVIRRNAWRSELLEWPDESFEPSTEEIVRRAGGWTPDQD